MERMTAKGSLSDFEVVCKIGEGAFSTVYKVIRKSDQMMYALKKVKIAQLKNKEKENALNEIRILASIDHPNIVAYKDAFIDDQDDTLCIVMEFLAGGDLYNKITECKKKRAMIPERLIWRYLIQMVRGLKYLHSMKIVHRDLKSANLFLSDDLKHIKLGDLNVSKVVKNRLVYTQTGTPYYASPEVWRDEPYDSKSDIWSLGCVVYEMCNRGPPFNARKMEELYQKVQKGAFERIASAYTDELQNMVSSFLRVSPILRPNCDEILENHFIRMRLKEIQADSPLDEEGALLLNTIKLTPNLRDLNNVLPEAKYDTDKKRGSSSRPDKLERRDSSTTRPTHNENAYVRPSAGRGSYSSKAMAPSPADQLSVQQAMAGNGLSPPIQVYLSPRNRSGSHQRNAQDRSETDFDGPSGYKVESRIERVKDMVRQYDVKSRSPSANARLAVGSSRNKVVRQSCGDGNVLDSSVYRRDSSVNSSVQLSRRVAEAAEINVGQLVHGKYPPQYFKPPTISRGEPEYRVPRRPSYERAQYLRDLAIPTSPKVRDSSGSIRSRLLLGQNSPQNQRNEYSRNNISGSRDYSAGRRMRTKEQIEEDIAQKVEDEILKKHRSRMLQLEANHAEVMGHSMAGNAAKGITLKKHPKVMGHLIGPERPAYCQNKLETVKRGGTAVENQSNRPSSTNRNSVNLLNEELRRIKRSAETRSRSRDYSRGARERVLSRDNRQVRVESKPSQAPGCIKGSSQNGQKPNGSISNREKKIPIELMSPSTLAGMDNLIYRKPSHSNRHLNDLQIEELDRINRRLDMMNNKNMLDKNVPASGPSLLGIRKKGLPNERSNGKIDYAVSRNAKPF